MFAFFAVNDSEPASGLGTVFLGWLLLFMLYAGAIVFFYGNLVSFLLEVLQKRVAVLRKDWLYIFLHGLLELANGLLFQNTIAALYGMGELFYTHYWTGGFSGEKAASYL
ncbi:hypothetical protein B9K06_07285 [Bacillus sp. OG2]|nr:hypothetical protein B9K06_07285 [Bacillus sp. OG2]